jgi:signal transduction histidine kinase
MSSFEGSFGANQQDTMSVPDRETRSGSLSPGVAARLAALFFIASALITLITLPLPAPQGFNRTATAAVAIGALVAGALGIVLPWDRWSPRWTLVAVPVAFTLIALGNAFGGTESLSYGIFFVVAFVWIGITQPRGTSILAAPLASVAYLLPLVELSTNLGADVASAIVTIPVCVLVGESLAWSVSQRIRTAERLAEQHETARRLRSSKAMQDTWIAAASHELRTPIAICRGHLELLEPDAGPRELHEVLGVVADEVDRMGRLVDDVTTLSRLEDRSFLEPRSIDLCGFLEKISKKGDALLPDRLQVHPVPDGAAVTADPMRLTQAILNLLQNAATHGGDGTVVVDARREASMWRFAVTDPGARAPVPAGPSLFEPFRLGDRSPRGSGLGLPIVRAVARAHGGSVGATHDADRGTTVWIEIPA